MLLCMELMHSRILQESFQSKTNLEWMKYWTGSFTLRIGGISYYFTDMSPWDEFMSNENAEVLKCIMCPRWYIPPQHSSRTLILQLVGHWSPRECFSVDHLYRAATLSTDRHWAVLNGAWWRSVTLGRVVALQWTCQIKMAQLEGD